MAYIIELYSCNIASLTFYDTVNIHVQYIDPKNIPSVIQPSVTQ
jgi:hypothetical protein